MRRSGTRAPSNRAMLGCFVRLRAARHVLGHAANDGEAEPQKGRYDLASSASSGIRISIAAFSLPHLPRPRVSS